MTCTNLITLYFPTKLSFSYKRLYTKFAKSVNKNGEVESPLQYWISPQSLQVVRFSPVSSVSSAKKQVPITRIRNRVKNFGNKSGYPVP